MDMAETLGLWGTGEAKTAPARLGSRGSGRGVASSGLGSRASGQAMAFQGQTLEDQVQRRPLLGWTLEEWWWPLLDLALETELLDLLHLGLAMQQQLFLHQMLEARHQETGLELADPGQERRALLRVRPTFFISVSSCWTQWRASGSQWKDLWRALGSHQVNAWRASKPCTTNQPTLETWGSRGINADISSPSWR